MKTKNLSIIILLLLSIQLAIATPDVNYINDQMKLYYDFSGTGLTATFGDANLTNPANNVTFSSTNGISGQYAIYSNNSYLPLNPYNGDNINGLLNITIGFSIKTSCPTETMIILSRTNNFVGTQQIKIMDDCDGAPYYDCGKLKYTHTTAVQPFQVSTNFNVCDNQWHKVIITKNISVPSTKIYIDGVDVTDNTYGGYSSASVLGEEYTLGISTTGYSFQGLLDEFFILNGSLTPENILFLNNTNQSYPFCYPSYSCGYYNACTPDNTLHCSIVSDSNNCSIPYTGNTTDFDMACDYAHSLIIYNETSLPTIVVDGTVKFISGITKVAIVIGIVLALAIMFWIATLGLSNLRKIKNKK